jgi:hypothetical protein
LNGIFKAVKAANLKIWPSSVRFEVCVTLAILLAEESLR